MMKAYCIGRSVLQAVPTGEGQAREGEVRICPGRPSANVRFPPTGDCHVTVTRLSGGRFRHDSLPSGEAAASGQRLAGRIGLAAAVRRGIRGPRC